MRKPVVGERQSGWSTEPKTPCPSRGREAQPKAPQAYVVVRRGRLWRAARPQQDRGFLTTGANLFAALLLFAMTSAGCSRVKIAYTWLDWVLEQQAKQYLDLTREQSDATAKAIDQYLTWHRATMLPRYARFLRETSDALRTGPITRAQFDANGTQLRGMYEQTVTGVVDAMADLLAQQSPGQIAHLERALAERHEEIVDDSVGPDKLDERVKSFQEGFEDLVGELRDDQKVELARRTRVMHQDMGPYLRERARRNRVLVQMLRNGVAANEIASTLRVWWLGQPDPATPPEYEPYRQRFAANMQDLLFFMFSSLDEKQRFDLARRLDDYATDFEDLAATS